MTHSILIAKASQTVDVDFGALPEISQKYFVEYGIRQSLNDATASLKKEDFKTVAEFQEAAMALVNKRLDGILKGELRQSVGRIGDPVEAEAIRVATATIANAILKKGGKLKDYTLKDMRERAMQLLERNPSIREKAAETVAARKNAADEYDLDGII